MRLHQLKLEYNVEQDRLLLRLATNQNAEVLLWLTRRCVLRLWSVLLDMAHATPEIALQPSPEARRALLGFRHAAAVSEAEFNQPYAEVPRTYPLGIEPLLVARVDSRKGEKGHILGLHPANGESLHINLDEKLVHGMLKLIENAVAKTDWDLTLRVAPGSVPTYADSGHATIN